MRRRARLAPGVGASSRRTAPGGLRRRWQLPRRGRRAPRRRRRTRRCRNGPTRSRACRRRLLPPRPCRSSRPPRRARTRPPADRARAAAGPSRAGGGHVRASARPAALAGRVGCSVPVVRPGDHEVGLGQLPNSREQMLDPLPGRDPADIENDRRCPRNAELRAKLAVRSPWRRARGSRCRGRAPFPPRTPHAITSSRLALRRDDDSSRATSHASIERRVEHALQHHLPQPRLEHPQRLEHVRHAREPAPRGVTGRDRIAEAEHVHDVGPVRFVRVRAAASA